jgi:hypothetical protein
MKQHVIITDDDLKIAAAEEAKRRHDVVSFNLIIYAILFYEIIEVGNRHTH